METLQNAMGMGSGGGGDASAGAGASTSGVGLGTADKLKLGGSAVAAISNFGMAMSKATQMQTAADQERLAANEEYIQAQEKTTAITAAYQQVVGAQLTTAAASGVDVASGSVQNAGKQAQLTADQESRKIRIGAQMTASQRMARYFAMKQAAGVQRATGFLNLAGDALNIASGAMGGGAPA